MIRSLAIKTFRSPTVCCLFLTRAQRPDVPTYPTAAQTTDYMIAYARHFDLYKCFRFNTVISHLEPASKGANGEHAESSHKPVTAWTLRFIEAGQEKAETFDRVVVATGANSKAWSPTIEGSELFTGRILHGQAFKGCVSPPDIG